MRIEISVGICLKEEGSNEEVLVIVDQKRNVMIGGFTVRETEELIALLKKRMRQILNEKRVYGLKEKI